MTWALANRADVRTRIIADRHYNRQKVGSPQFVPPGRCLVLRAVVGSAAWVTSWPFGRYVKHDWAGCRVNSLFRRESGPAEASEMILDAVAATRWDFGDDADSEDRGRWVPMEHLGSFAGKPRQGPVRHWPLAKGAPMVSFVDASKTRRKRDPGRCYRRAGFRHAGFTRAGLWAFLLIPGEMPDPMPPVGAQLEAA